MPNLWYNIRKDLIMKLSIKTYVSNKNTNVKASVTITIDDAFVIRAAAVEGKYGLFISYPNAKGHDGKYYDKVYCLKSEITEQILNKVKADINAKTTPKAITDTDLEESVEIC